LVCRWGLNYARVAFGLALASAYSRLQHRLRELLPLFLSQVREIIREIPVRKVSSRTPVTRLPFTRRRLHAGIDAPKKRQ
jgi:hypothetical protein